MNTILKSLRRNAFLLSIAAIWMIFPACSTVQSMTENNRLQVANHIQRDSIYLRDSVFVRIRADTVYLEKWHTRWRDRIVQHTDTIQVETTRTETVQVRYVPSFYKYCAVILALIVLGFLLRLAWWLYKHFH